MKISNCIILSLLLLILILYRLHSIYFDITNHIICIVLILTVHLLLNPYQSPEIGKIRVLLFFCILVRCLTKPVMREMDWKTGFPKTPMRKKISCQMIKVRFIGRSLDWVLIKFRNIIVWNILFRERQSLKKFPICAKLCIWIDQFK